MFEHLKYVNFTTKNGAKVVFDVNGDSVGQYDLVNGQLKEDGSVEIITVGQYDDSLSAEKKFSLKKDAKIVWRGNTDEVIFAIISNSLSQLSDTQYFL